MAFDLVGVGRTLVVFIGLHRHHSVTGIPNRRLFVLQSDAASQRVPRRVLAQHMSTFSLQFINQPGGAILMVLVMERNGEVVEAAATDELSGHSYLSLRFLDLLRVISYGDDWN